MNFYYSSTALSSSYSDKKGGGLRNQDGKRGIDLDGWGRAGVTSDGENRTDRTC